MSTKVTNIDLSNCDKEKIHQITYVQGHGAFIAVSPLDMKIHHASDNFPSFFDEEGNVQFVIGRKLSEFMESGLVKEIQDRLRSGTIRFGRQGRLSHKGDKGLDIYMYQIQDNLYGIEFTQLANMPEHEIPAEELLNDFVHRMHGCKSLELISKEACKAVRQITGMDRVMIYKFFPPSMYGEVIAEDKIASAHTFMNHRFPATDIPKPARDLYLRNQVRFIHDSQGTLADIYPATDKNRLPLDMSDSKLRGVSLIHLEYLKNMGVRGSLSAAIIIDNELWGIISCHSREPIVVSHEKRSMCATIANTLAMGASMFEKMSYQSFELSFFNRFHELFGKLKGVNDPLDQLFREGSKVLELFNCNGMVLVSKDKTDLFGITPLPADIKKIWAWLMVRMENEGKAVYSTNSLSTERPEFADIKEIVSGVLAIRMSEVSDSILILMRSEYVETIQWGGDPRKNIDARNYGGSINPRISFETWTEVLKSHSLLWQKFEISGITFFKNLVFDSLVARETLMNEMLKARS